MLDELPSPISAIEGLDKLQQGFVSASRHALAGLLQMKEPSATAKSFLSVNMSSLFILSRKKPTVLAIAPTKQAANSTNTATNENWKECIKKRPDLRNRYVVRLYSKSREEKLRTREGRPRPDRKDGAGPLVRPSHEVSFHDLNAIEPTVQAIYDKAHPFPVLSIREKRLTDRTL